MAKKKEVSKTRRIPKSRINPSSGTSEVYYETETYTEWVTDYSSSSSDCGSGYDSGSYDSGSSSCDSY
jgi:hypothetical protein